ncbi:uncharacterized protein [Hetaerina americana]|uniref:uncharacterized protein isoform X3 n=1 Tax=Hetaerina americana TaxID=62018 RepID=UPI003A7F326D
MITMNAAASPLPPPVAVAASAPLSPPPPPLHHPPPPPPPPPAAEVVAKARAQEREALSHVIVQWNANRLDLFELSEPNEDLEFHGVMRFYFQDSGQKVATKCIRVASSAPATAVVETLIEKFRPDMRMLSVPEYALYEIHENGDERRLADDEKPLLVQLNWHKDDREGRFLLRRIDDKTNVPAASFQESGSSFRRKLSKREKKQLKKQEKLNKLKGAPGGAAAGTGVGTLDVGGPDGSDVGVGVAEKLYTELPETSFTRSISNPEAVMRRRRQQKLERKLQQFRSKDGGPDTGGTLKIYGESLCRDVPYKTLLLSVRDTAAAVVREMLAKYGLARVDPSHYCLIQVNVLGPDGGAEGSKEYHGGTNREYILDDDECPLAILMNHPSSRGSIMFHVRRRPADYHPRKRKKKPQQGGGPKGGGKNSGGGQQDLSHPGGDLHEYRRYDDSYDRLPFLLELHPDGSDMVNGIPKKHRLQLNVTEVGSEERCSGGVPGLGGGSQSLQLFGPNVQPRHCVVAHTEGIVTVTPCSRDAETYVNGQRIYETTILQNGAVVKFGRIHNFRFLDPSFEDRTSRQRHDSSRQGHDYSDRPSSNYERYPVLPSQSKPPSGASDPILPAALEFREEATDALLDALVTSLDPQAAPHHFRLAPTYALYLAARFRASTHYRPELAPTERAHRLTALLARVAATIRTVVQERYGDAESLAFWMANASELLHFLKSDRHISAFSIDGQDILAEAVQIAFRNLVLCLQADLGLVMPNFLADRDDDRNEEESAGSVLQVLASAMALLRRCRVNAALTIQLFSQLFHYVNVWTFNRVVASAVASSANNAMHHSHHVHHVHLSPRAPSYCSREWGLRLGARLARVEAWAERQGLELAADCHLSRITQVAHLLQAPKYNAEDLCAINSACFKLNSLQLRVLLTNYQHAPDERRIPMDLVENVVRVAENVCDDLVRNEGREVRLEEEEGELLRLQFLLPDDGYSCDVVRGLPPGLVELLGPLQRANVCRLVPQHTSAGFWTVYMTPPPSAMLQHSISPEGHSQHPQTPNIIPHVPRSPSALSNRSGGMDSSSSRLHGSTGGHLPAQMTSPQHLVEPETQVIKLHKSNSGMGLSIVAAKGAGQDRLGIYIKSVVKGGAADADSRLQAGDQLLKVDGQSLVGITQEKAAEYLVRTGPVVTLEVAKQGAIYHGLATLLSQPSPVMTRAHRPSSINQDWVGRYSLTSRPGMPTSTSLPQLRPPLPRKQQYQQVGSGGTIQPMADKYEQITTGPRRMSERDLPSKVQGEHAHGSLGSSGRMGDLLPPPHLPTMHGSKSVPSLNSGHGDVGAMTIGAPSQQAPSSASIGASPPVVGQHQHHHHPQAQQQQPNHLHLSHHEVYNPGYSRTSSTNSIPQKSAGYDGLRSRSSQNLSEPRSPAPVPGQQGLGARQASNPGLVSLSQQHHQYSPPQQGAGPPSQPQSNPSQQGAEGERFYQNLSIYRSQQPETSQGLNGFTPSSPNRGKLVSPPGPAEDIRVTQGGSGKPSALRGSQSSLHRQVDMASGSNGTRDRPVSAYIPQNGPQPIQQLQSVPRSQSSRDFMRQEAKLQEMQEEVRRRREGGRPPQASASPPLHLHHQHHAPPRAHLAQPTQPQKGSAYSQMTGYPDGAQNSPGHHHSHHQPGNVQHLGGFSSPYHGTLLSPTSPQPPSARGVASSGAPPPTAPKPRPLGTTGDVGPLRPPPPEDVYRDSPPPPPPPPTSTHPLYQGVPKGSTATTAASSELNNEGRYNASAGDPPKGSFYPTSTSSQSHQRQFPYAATNPWDREEKEKGNFEENHEMRPSGGLLRMVLSPEESQDYHPSRKSLGALDALNGPQVMHQQVHETQSYGGQLSQLGIRPSQHHPNGPLRLDNLVVNGMGHGQLPSAASPRHNGTHQSYTESQLQQQGGYLPREDRSYQSSVGSGSQRLDSLLSLGPTSPSVVGSGGSLSPGAPAPPERGSSFAIMSQQQVQQGAPNSSGGVLRNANGGGGGNGPATPMGGPGLSLTAGTPTSTSNTTAKRVSFHDSKVVTFDDNANHQERSTVREDPNNFINEAQTMLATPRSPDGSFMANTPGVIGAQEVYRDPRTRRLAEQQKLMVNRTGPLPEKLSFKEKMKMFAMETGEDGTPKDKVKISRAQRDIEGPIPPNGYSPN